MQGAGNSIGPSDASARVCGSRLRKKDDPLDASNRRIFAHCQYLDKNTSTADEKLLVQLLRRAKPAEGEHGKEGAKAGEGGAVKGTWKAAEKARIGRKTTPPSHLEVLAEEAEANFAS